MKDHIRSLHHSLLSCSEFEKTLQKKVKHVAQEVMNQRMEIDRTGSKQYANNAEIGDLKRHLLKVGCTHILNAAISLLKEKNMFLERICLF
jgi:hypothetical protein